MFNYHSLQVVGLHIFFQSNQFTSSKQVWTKQTSSCLDIHTSDSSLHKPLLEHLRHKEIVNLTPNVPTHQVITNLRIATKQTVIIDLLKLVDFLNIIRTNQSPQSVNPNGQVPFPFGESVESYHHSQLLWSFNSVQSVTCCWHQNSLSIVHPPLEFLQHIEAQKLQWKILLQIRVFTNHQRWPTPKKPANSNSAWQSGNYSIV